VAAPTVRAALLAALAVANCGPEGEALAGSKYVVQVDLTPQIRAFGEDTATADEAGEQVAAIGPAAIPALAAALTHEPRDVRQKAVEVLTTIGTAAAVPPLLQAAQHDDDVDVRADAVHALGTLGAERGRAVVEAMLADSHAPIRGGAVMACASLCTSDAAIARLADIAVMDDDVSIALGAWRTLLALRAKPALADVVRSTLARRRAAPLPSNAKPNARALLALIDYDSDGPAAIPSLLAAVGEASPPVQRQIVWQLGTVGDDRCIVALRELLHAPDTSVQAYAYDALVKLRDRGIDGAATALDAYPGRKPSGPLRAPDL
jgi:HEAT repeat protein